MTSLDSPLTTVCVAELPVTKLRFRERSTCYEPFVARGIYLFREDGRWQGSVVPSSYACAVAYYRNGSLRTVVYCTERTNCQVSSSHYYNFSNWGILVGHTTLYTPVSLLMGQIAIDGTPQPCTPLLVC